MEFEKAGKPAAVIYESIFETLAVKKKSLMGMPAYQGIVIPYPLGAGVTAAAKADATIDQIISWLTEGKL